MIGTNGTHGVLNGRGRSGSRQPQHQDADRDDHEREQRADGHQLPSFAHRGTSRPAIATAMPVKIVVM